MCTVSPAARAHCQSSCTCPLSVQLHVPTVSQAARAHCQSSSTCALSVQLYRMVSAGCMPIAASVADARAFRRSSRSFLTNYFSNFSSMIPKICLNKGESLLIRVIKALRFQVFKHDSYAMLQL